MPLAVLSALANHLWQSTVFAIAAALLAAALKNNAARTRYWIWLTASVKFLIPFSLLIAAGSRVGERVANRVTGEPSVSAIVIGQVAQPFAPRAVRVVSARAATSRSRYTLPPALRGSLLAVCMCGCSLMVLRWFVRWRRLRNIVRRSTVLREGREFDILRRVEQTAGIRRPIALLSSPAAIEPSVLGLFGAVLVWPGRLSPRLSDEELEAIFLHELTHVLRHDNLAAALHMVVETLFWFHPLVWWLGMRLVHEREKACDEEVIRRGRPAHVYASGILKVCEFCLESPLSCAAGVTGSDLKRRIEEIMKDRIAIQLSFTRVLLLSAAAITSVACPIVIGAIGAKPDAYQYAGAAGRTAQPSPADTGQIPREPAQPIQILPEEPPDNSAADPRDTPDTVASIPDQVQSAPQPPPLPESFETASIRPSSPVFPGGRRGGPRGAAGGPPVPGQRGGRGGTPSPCTGGPAQIGDSRFSVTNKTLYSLITMAYGMNCPNTNSLGLISGGPEWIGADQFDLEAVLPDGSPNYTGAQFASGDAPQLQTMIRNLLADRFKLSFHTEMRDVPGYALSLKSGAPPPPPSNDVRRISISPSGLTATKISMTDLAGVLTLITGRPTLDRTGFAMEFDIDIKFVLSDLPALTAALDERGIDLEAVTVPLEIMVIDSAEKPTE